MSPNRKEVVKKSLGGGLSETQAAQYLLETQVTLRTQIARTVLGFRGSL
jgi:hypothetical protein